jgi:hypothetical protein
MNSNIPDLEKLTNDILDFIEFVDKPENIELRKSQGGNFNYILNEKFKDMPSSMFKLLLDFDNRSSNLEKILDMINMLRNVKNGNTSLKNAENEFAEKRAEEYLYPAFGGKEQFYKVANENKKKGKGGIKFNNK